MTEASGWDCCIVCRLARKTVNRLHRRPATKRGPASTTSFLSARENGPKPVCAKMGLNNSQRSSMMWTLLSLIYRSYCRARLQEMRKARLGIIA
jgi:hypothetical protein